MQTDVILLVEDNADDVFMTTRAFASSGLQVKVMVARDGQHAAELLLPDVLAGRGDEPLCPALVLTDLRMPRMDGLELLKLLRADPRTRTLPVLLLTSSDHDPSIARAYELGANGYVVKPLTPEQFTAAVHQVGLYWLGLNRRPPASHSPEPVERVEPTK